MEKLPHSDELGNLLTRFPKWFLPAGIAVGCSVLLLIYLFSSRIEYADKISAAANITSDTGRFITGYFDMNKSDMPAKPEEPVLEIISAGTIHHKRIEPYDTICISPEIARIYFRTENLVQGTEQWSSPRRYSVSVAGDTLNLYDKIKGSLSFTSKLPRR